MGKIFCTHSKNAYKTYLRIQMREECAKKFCTSGAFYTHFGD